MGKVGAYEWCGSGSPCGEDDSAQGSTFPIIRAKLPESGVGLHIDFSDKQSSRTARKHHPTALMSRPDRTIEPRFDFKAIDASCWSVLSTIHCLDCRIEAGLGKFLKT